MLENVRVAAQGHARAFDFWSRARRPDGGAGTRRRALLADDRARRQGRRAGRAPLARREAAPRDRHRARVRSDAPPARRADRGHEPRGDRRDDAAHPRARGRAHGDPRRAQDEARDEDLRPHHRAPPGRSSSPRARRTRSARTTPVQQTYLGASRATRMPRDPLLAVEDIHTLLRRGAHPPGHVAARRRGRGRHAHRPQRRRQDDDAALDHGHRAAEPRAHRARRRRHHAAARRTRSSRRGIAWVPEERRVLPNLTVLENLRLGMLAAPAPRTASARIDEVVRDFPRLRERIDQKGQFLSGGEQQMLAIARGLVASRGDAGGRADRGAGPAPRPEPDGDPGAINKRRHDDPAGRADPRGRDGAVAPPLRHGPGAHPVQRHAEGARPTIPPIQQRFLEV